MEYIALIHYKGGGYNYNGPTDDLKALIATCKEDIEYEKEIEDTYVFPYDPETGLPDSDTDPLWIYKRCPRCHGKGEIECCYPNHVLCADGPDDHNHPCPECGRK